MTPPATHDDALALADELRPPLRRLYRKLRRESDDSDLGISPMQKLLLVAISENPGIGTGELARMEKLRGPTISGHIKALENAGLVTRAPIDPVDRRRFGLGMTGAGQQLLETLRRRRRDWLAQQLASLSAEARQAIRNAIPHLSEIGQ